MSRIISYSENVNHELSKRFCGINDVLESIEWTNLGN